MWVTCLVLRLLGKAGNQSEHPFWHKFPISNPTIKPNQDSNSTVTIILYKLLCVISVDFSTVVQRYIVLVIQSNGRSPKAQTPIPIDRSLNKKKKIWNSQPCFPAARSNPSIFTGLSDLSLSLPTFLSISISMSLSLFVFVDLYVSAYVSLLRIGSDMKPAFFFFLD